MTPELAGLVVALGLLGLGLAAMVAAAVFLLIMRAVLSPHPAAARTLPGFTCPVCRSTAQPRTETRVAPVGWVLFGAVPLLAAPLAGMVRERWRVCAGCGFRFVVSR